MVFGRATLTCISLRICFPLLVLKGIDGIDILFFVQGAKTQTERTSKSCSPNPTSDPIPCAGV